MSRRREGQAAKLSPSPPAEARPPGVPKRHPWQLAISTALMLAWMLFLAWMAWSG